MKQYDSPPDLTIELDGEYGAILHTSLGDIAIEFLPATAPLAVNNFLFLAREGFYDTDESTASRMVFHRVISGFMLQVGDPTGSGRGGPGYRFRDELEGPGTYERGTVAMANAGPNTNGSQFFIMHRAYALPHNYTIFGKVTDGLDVVDTIAALETDSNDRPHEEQTIQSVTVTGV